MSHIIAAFIGLPEPNGLTMAGLALLSLAAALTARQLLRSHQPW